MSADRDAGQVRSFIDAALSMAESHPHRQIQFTGSNPITLGEFAAALAEYVATQQRDTIALLGARLDQMRADFPTSIDPLSRAFDDGWNGARLQIGPNILDPKIAAHIRASMPEPDPS